ncbi:hypothetical protein C8Q72DRAFT_73204 [Fomitopsis betulina]|nr:hypothetical protein C8Q72DRAFT_73204 [Fomitopsis betulina]
MPPHRNMGWRKPVPKFIPETAPISRLSSSSFKRMSFSQLNKDVPPLPDERLLRLGGSLSKAKRQGFVLDDIDHRWLEEFRSHPVSFPTVQEDPSEEDLRSLLTTSTVPGVNETAYNHNLPRVVRHKRSLPRVCRQLPVWLPCSVDNSPDQHYRPPTPPLKREHPERRPRSAHQTAPQIGQPFAHASHEKLTCKVGTCCAQLTVSPTPAAHVRPSYGTARPAGYAHGRPRPAGASVSSSVHSRSLSSSSSALRARRHGQGIVTIWADVKTLGIQVRLRFHHLFR